MKRNFSATVIAVTLSFVNIALFVFLLVATDLFSQRDLWFQSSCVIIGTIVTAVITLLLLNGQSDKEEEKERNAKVFEEKLAIYKEFLNTLCNIVKDVQITDEEYIELQFLVAQIAMHTDKKHIDEISNYLAGIIEPIKNKNLSEDKSPIIENLFFIQEQFRQVLYNSTPEDWSDVIDRFKKLNNGKKIPTLSIEKLKELKEELRKKYEIVDFKAHGFEFVLSKEVNGKSRNFIRFVLDTTERGEHCVQVWLNALRNIDSTKVKIIYQEIRNNYKSSYYSVNASATIPLDLTEDELKKNDVVKLYADKFSDVIKFTEDKLNKTIPRSPSTRWGFLCKIFRFCLAKE